VCIAVYVPANIKISDEYLKECYRSNPDGAGIMYSDGNTVFIHKGYMKQNEFVDAFRAIPEEYDRSFHCRIATSGRVDAGNCHPFPVTDDMKEMRKIEHQVHAGICHNGIISWTAPEKGKESWYSDTMNFTAQVIHPLQNQLDSKVIRELIERSTTGSKFIIMTPTKTFMFGHFQQEGGVFYSNNSFRPATTTYYSSKGKYNDKVTIENLAWILIENPYPLGLTGLSNHLLKSGIEIFEEENVEYNGTNASIFLVDKIPGTEKVWGYNWYLIDCNGEKTKIGG
jgi:predicted glutamine amidotransferase